MLAYLPNRLRPKFNFVRKWNFFAILKKRRKKGKDGMNVPFPFKARFKLQFSIFGLISILAGLDTWEIPSFHLSEVEWLTLGTF